MIIEHKTERYTLPENTPINAALKRMNANDVPVLISVKESGIIEGVFSAGDLVRWAATEDSADFTLPLNVVSNKDFKSAKQGASMESIALKISNTTKIIPILDERRRLVSVARQRERACFLGNRRISKNDPAFIIAEIGNNHNGSIDTGKRLIEAAQKAGADCAKFQLRDLEQLYGKALLERRDAEDLGSQYTIDLLQKTQLSPDGLYQLFDFCKDAGILPLCTPWDKNSLYRLEDYGMEGFKISSADFTNHDLIKSTVALGKTLICSTGMSSNQEIAASINLLRTLGAQFALLHCNSTYPAPFKDIQLSYMKTLEAQGNCPVGYSSHDRGGAVCIAAIAMGATIIEKHFTLDPEMEGIDHKISLTPHEFKNMVDNIRNTESAIGNNTSRNLSQGEILNREILGKSLVAAHSLQAGEVITEASIEVRSPGRGVSPARKSEFIGKRALRGMNAGDIFFESDLEEKQASSRNYQFNRPFGIPIRYHDFEQLYTKSNIDLVEIHLSYRDLEVDFNKYLKGQQLPLSFLVHAPELFPGDHIIDLASENASYRNRSIQEIRRVINETVKLIPRFNQASVPRIIVNAGGTSIDATLSKREVRAGYQRVAEALDELRNSQVEIIIQSMPPFPWHFGGQRHHNLFVDPTEIEKFCKDNSVRICLDISHSQLACNYYGWRFGEFCKSVGKYVAHLHVADSKGFDGEGLQIGHGDVDIVQIAELLNLHCPKTSFIPEIWQGHKNQGEGFWRALEQLEGHL